VGPGDDICPTTHIAKTVDEKSLLGGLGAGRMGYRYGGSTASLGSIVP
jgi:hypothetical protein